MDIKWIWRWNNAAQATGPQSLQTSRSHKGQEGPSGCIWTSNFLPVVTGKSKPLLRATRFVSFVIIIQAVHTRAF